MCRSVKISFYLCLMLVFANAESYGQSRGYFTNENDTRTFYGGLLIGANFSTVDGDNYGGYHKVGLNTGGVVYARFLPMLFGSLEFLYTQKGSRGVKVFESSYVGTAIEKYYLDLNYVEVPVIVHYAFTDQLNIGIGGAYAQLLKSKEDVYTDQPIFLDPAKYPFRKDDYSFILDAGFQIGSGLFVKGRFQYSTATIRDFDKVPIGFGAGNLQYNNLFSLRVMYLIGSAKE
jgi:hypothetical protein